MIVIGIDIGIRSNPTGLVAIWDEGATPELLMHQNVDVSQLAATNFDMALLQAGMYVRRFIDECLDTYSDGVELIGIEYPHVLHATTALELAEFVGVIVTVAGFVGIPLQRVAVSTAKAALTGSGSAGKRAMVNAAAMMFDIDRKDISDHEADAAGVALGAIKMLREAQWQQMGLTP